MGRRVCVSFPRVWRGPVSLRSLLEDAAAEARRRSEGRQIVLPAGEEATVLGDEIRLRQVFSNLVDNALRHTPVDGAITLRLESVEGWASIDVADTGEGIPPEHLPRIFKRFYQVGKATGTGVGLGLAIVKHLTEAHGGRISAESEPGRGSRFTVALPLAPNGASPSVENAGIAPSGDRRPAGIGPTATS